MSNFDLPTVNRQIYHLKNGETVAPFSVVLSNGEPSAPLLLSAVVEGDLQQTVLSFFS